MVDIVGRAVVSVSSQINRRSFEKDGTLVGKAFQKGALLGVAALGALGTAAIRAGFDAEEAAKQQRVLSRVLQNMGKGDAAERLSEVAAELGKVAGIDDEVIKGGQTILATFSEVAKSADEVGGAFDRATKLTADLAASGFGDISSGAKALGKALQDPVKGVSALSRAGVTFTAVQKEQIANFIKTGEVGQAQNLVLKEVEKQVGGTAEAAATGSARLKTALGEASESVGFLLADLFEQEGKKSFLDQAADATFEFSDAVSKFQKSSDWKDLKKGMRNFGGDVKTVAGGLADVVGFLDRMSKATTGSGLVDWLVKIQDNLSGISILADTLDRISKIWDVINGKEGAPFKGSTNKELTELLIPGMAGGGRASGGLTLVGERGPELVNMPAGANVTNAANTRKAFTSASKNNVTVVINEYGPRTSIGRVREADWAYRFATQARGTA